MTTFTSQKQSGIWAVYVQLNDGRALRLSEWKNQIDALQAAQFHGRFDCFTCVNPQSIIDRLSEDLVN